MSRYQSGGTIVPVETVCPGGETVLGTLCPTVIFQGTTDYLNIRSKNVSLATSSIFVFVWVVIVVIAIISSTYSKQSKWVLGLSWVLVIAGFAAMLMSWLATDDIRTYFYDKLSANEFPPGANVTKCPCPGWPNQYVHKGSECPVCPAAPLS